MIIQILDECFAYGWFNILADAESSKHGQLAPYGI